MVVNTTNNRIVSCCNFCFKLSAKKRKSIIITNIISRLLYIVQYLLLGAISGVVLDLLGMISSLIAERKHLLFVKRHLKILFLSINIIIIITGLIIAVANKSLLDRQHKCQN